jgi:hypothetical protein
MGYDYNKMYEEYMKIYGTSSDYVNAAVAAGELGAAKTYAEAENLRRRAAIDANYAAALAQADATRQQGISSANQATAAANDAYERDKVTYGMAAEQLAQSGLSQSGYSDNLARDAYATRGMMYADAQRMAAAAEQKAVADKAAADAEYRGALSYADAEKAKDDLVLGTGAKAQAKAYEDYAKYTLADIDNDTLLTPEQKQTIKSTRNTAIAGEIESAIKYGDYATVAATIEGLDALKNGGYIDETLYTELKNKYENSPTVLTAMYSLGLMSDTDYASKLSAIDNAAWAEFEEQRKAAGDKADTIAAPNVIDEVSSFNPTSVGWAIEELGNGEVGDSFKITIGSSTFDKENAIEASVGKEVTNPTTARILNELATGDAATTPESAGFFGRFFGAGGGNSSNHAGQLVVYRGDAYVYQNSKWRKVNTPAVATALLAQKKYAN